MKGNDPDSKPYTGVLEISRNREVFSASWELSYGSATGTGVCKNGYLAISFEGEDDLGEPFIGGQRYKIQKNTLQGPWTLNGIATQGNEIAKKLLK